MKNFPVYVKLLLLLLGVFVTVTIASAFGIYSMNLIKDESLDILDTALREDFDNLIKEQVETSVTILQAYNARYESGELTLEEAKLQAADTIRALRYGSNGYFWVDDAEGNNIVLLGSDTEGTNRINATDAGGIYFIQEIIKNSKQDGGGYLDYQFPKEGETEPSPKRAYSLYFEPFNWVIGTGNYVDNIDVQLGKSSDLMSAVGRKYSLAMVSTSFFLFILITGFALYIIINITKPLKQTVSMLDVLATGDMTKRASSYLTDRKDEFGKVCRAMNNLAIMLDDVLGDVHKCSENLNDAVNIAVVNIQTLNGEIENVSATTEELSAEMEEMSANAQLVDTLSQEIEEVSKSIAVKAQEGTEKVNGIFQRAIHAKQQTETSQKQTDSIRNEISESLASSLEGAKVVNEINVLAENIMGITSQTNLLALNASIEAARAGESGKGFAVVASEIQNLAEQSRISVENIQKVTKEVIEAVDHLSADAERLLQFVSDNVSENFTEFHNIADAYNSDATYVDDMITDFSAISQQLLSSVNNVYDSISNVNRAAYEGAQGTTDIAERSTDVAQQSSDVMQHINLAGSTATHLIENVNKFTVTKA